MKKLLIAFILTVTFFSSGSSMLEQSFAQDSVPEDELTGEQLEERREAEAARNKAAAEQAEAAAAASVSTTKNFYTGTAIKPDASRYTLDGLINVLLPGAARWIAGFLGALAVIFLIWAGIQFLTAEGEPDKIGQAIKTAFYVIAGVLLVMFASALVYLFLTIFAPTI